MGYRAAITQDNMNTALVIRDDDDSLETMPCDELGYPVGKSTLETAHAIKRPDGVSQERWQGIISAAAEIFRRSKGMDPPTKEAVQAYTGFSTRIINCVFDNGPGELAFNRAMAMRGIIRGIRQLTPEMTFALAALSDFTSGESLQLRLKKLGITWIQFQNWLKYPPFADQYKELGEQALIQAQASAMIGLAERSQTNDSSLKYMLQLNGRYDPNRQGQADVRAFLNGLVEVLQRHLSGNPDLMRAIAGDLSILTSTHLGA